jgi:hypothetical protein
VYRGGDTYEETGQLIREAVPFHLEGMLANGDAIPEPTTRIEFVDVGTRGVKLNLADTIRRHVLPLGGVELKLPPRAGRSRNIPKTN